MSTNRFMKSSNPFLKQEKFAQEAASSGTLDGHLSTQRGSNVMTVQGAINKTMVLTGILIISAMATILNIEALLPYFSTIMYGGGIVALILAVVSFMKPNISGITAPLYAVFKGSVIGVVTFAYASSAQTWGIVLNAVLLTALCLVVMLVVYRTGLIKVTEKFRSVMVTAIGAIFLVYLVNFVMSMFGASIPYLHEGGVIGIGISLVVLTIATLSLLLDFDNMERGAQMGAPKYMEWATGLGLLVTLVWIYFEILSLLSRFNND